MKWLKKNMVLVVVVFLIMSACLWIIRRPSRDGFTETPIVEISKVIYGKTGDDIKSILERYESSVESPEAIDSIKSVLEEIDLIEKEIDDIKNKCENDTCDNIEVSEIEKRIPILNKLLENVKQIMENPLCHISEPDKIQLQDNISRGRGT